MKRGLLDSHSTPEPSKCPCLVPRLALLANAIASIAAVVYTKEIFLKNDFPALTLTFIQLAVTSVCVLAARECGLFAPVKLQLKSVLILSFAFCTFVTFGNLSLRYNNIVSYIIFKIETLIIIPILQYYFFNHLGYAKNLAILIPVGIGLSQHLYGQRTGITGIICGFIAALATAIYQVYLNDKQKEIQVNTLQVLWYVAPISTLLLIPLVFVFDAPDQWFGAGETEKPVTDIYTLSLLCSSQAAIHFTTHVYAGRMTIMETNIVSQIKFLITMLYGYGSLDSGKIEPIKLTGDILTFCGILLHAHLRLSEDQQGSYKKEIDEEPYFDCDRV